MKKITTATFTAALLALSATAQADSENTFSGPYIGAQIGISDQSDETELAGALFAGYRTQLDNNIVLGGEFAFGSVDDNITKNVWSILGTAGLTVGSNDNGLAYVGLGYTKINTDLGISGDDYIVAAGYEHALSNTWSVRGQISTAGFHSTDLTVGVLARF